MIKVLIVEDHPFARQTLIYDLKKFENIELLGAMVNAEESVKFVQNPENKTPDVILMDIMLPTMNGIEASKIIKEMNNDIKIIMLTSHSEREKVLDAFAAEVNGYCVKDIKIKELIEVIDIIMDGGVWFDKKIAGYILEILKNPPKITQTKTAVDFGITSREKEVIELISTGASNKEITEKLVVSLSTVKNHVANILKKLSLADRTQIAIFALNNELN